MLLSRFFALCATLLLVAVLPTIAQNNSEGKHPIDSALDLCMDKNPSTTGTVNCIEKAYKEWDAELNKYYKLLQGVCNEQQKKALRTVQLAWIAYRDKEFEVIDKLYESKEGTMFVPMAAYDKAEVVKKRALELKSHYELLTEY
ncbi:MAG TPA: DUF1311 domain-containing protein [Chitinophagales bacterium]|nr:DUF1311 domain-containing protein [Chitinophagales bacterium]HRK26037.1 DUF1311 domain-containing protein [Chitinophagales bacterium]